MADIGGEFTPEERAAAEKVFDELLRAASREQYRQLVAANDPRLHQGPVRVPRDEVMRLREQAAEMVRARRHTAAPPPHVSKPRRWPWQRGPADQ